MQIYGIDLSMEKFDVNCVNDSNEEKHFIVNNNVNSIARFLVKLPEDVLLCVEHTGVYGDTLLFLCNQLEVPISFISGYEIKHSLGLVKGKSDKTDARRIREYGERFRDKLKLAKYNNESIQELKELYTFRGQLVKERKMLETLIKTKSHSSYNSIFTHQKVQDVMDVLDSSIKEIEDEIMQIINSVPELKRNYDLCVSIKGIGQITTCDLIIKTGNFKTIYTAKKAASYAGVCPFPNESGKIIKRNRVSKMGDKSLKTLLYLCAKSASQHNKEYKLYYQKKQMEGKPHYLILNNISNKLLRTIYSVINTGVAYDSNYICSDPRKKTA